METFSSLLALVRGIHRLPVESPHKDQWRGALMSEQTVELNNRDAGDLSRHRAHYDVTAMEPQHDGVVVVACNQVRIHSDTKIDTSTCKTYGFIF